MFTNKFRKFENLHILFWLIKDMCWVSNFKVVGVLMVIPTLLMAFFLTYKSKDQIHELLHNLAVCFWILANSTWMIGEFFFNDGTRPIAIMFFIIGFIPIVISYAKGYWTTEE